MLAAEPLTRRLFCGAYARLSVAAGVRSAAGASAVVPTSCQHNKRRRHGGRPATSIVAYHSSLALKRSASRLHSSSLNPNFIPLLGSNVGTFASKFSVRLLSSSTDASLLGDDGFDPFVTHHNAKDAERADQMVRDYVKRRLASGAGTAIRQDFLRGALNSYRILSEKSAERSRMDKRRPDASFAKKADDLLAFMEQAYAQDPTLSLDTKCYNMVVDAYAKIGDPEGAEAILLRLEKLWRSGNEKVKPDTILYSAVLDAWAKSGRKEAPKRAEAILQHMDQLNQQGHEDVRPTTISFSAVINAWAKSQEKGAAGRAEAILYHMLKLYEGGREECRPNTGLSDAKPDTIAYNALINAIATSSIPDKAPRAYNMLLEMEDRSKAGEDNLAPNTQSYGTALKACARASMGKSLKRKDEALRIALMTFEKLRNNPHVLTDPYKYAPLFTIINNTSKGAQYEKLTREVFRLCCEDGVLNDKQLKDLCRFAPKDVFRKLVGTNDAVTVRDLPPEWSRNNGQR